MYFLLTHVVSFGLGAACMHFFGAKVVAFFRKEEQKIVDTFNRFGQ